MLTCHQFILSIDQAFEGSPAQAIAVEKIAEMMRSRMGPDHSGLAEDLIPKTFGFGCRYDAKRNPQSP